MQTDQAIGQVIGNGKYLGTACLGLLLSLGVLYIPQVSAQTVSPESQTPPEPAKTELDTLDRDEADLVQEEADKRSQARADEARPEEERTNKVGRKGIKYDLKVEGLKHKVSDELFKEISVLRKNRNKSARAQAELQSWVQRDVKSLNEILRSQGYYANRISYRLDRRKTPLEVTLRVIEGPQFKIGTFKVDLHGMPETELARAESQIIQQSFFRRIPKEGSPAESARVIEAEQLVLQRLPQIGYPRVELGERDVVVDHATQLMEVELNVTPGPRTCFGDAEFTGAPNVSRKYLNRLPPWKFGDVYDSRVVEEFREELSETLIFSGISTNVGESDRLGCASVVVELSEDKPRSYGAGATYGSSDGFGLNAFWEHRNFAGAGEHFRVEGKAVELEQSLLLSYQIPGFMRRNQWLLLNGGFERESTDAYTSYSILAGGAVKRKIRKFLTIQGGGSVELSSIDDGLSEKKFYLLGGQGVAAYDSTNDIFNPTRGEKITISLRPYVGQQSGFLNFNIAEIGGSYYWPIDNRRRYLLATRVKFGSIFGASNDNIPANKLFFAGGGSSVRGYAYQAAGPLDARNNPTGGRSLFEGSLELRARVTDTIGVVPFVDVGSVGPSVLPDFSDKLYWGAGLGLRYYTSFAPVRVDFAVPLNRRPTDSRFQIYISLGQSF